MSSGCDGQLLAVDVDHLRLGRHHLARLHRTLQQPRHLERALEGGDVRRVLERGLDTRVELADRGEHDAGLAERRQHRLDVLQERPRRADDEHTAGRQLLAMGVEQVGGSVQRDRGLAGARPALHDERAAELGPDDRILLGLDGGDDVGHAPGPLGGECRHQRGLALQLQPVGVEELGVEHLVVDPDDLAALAGQVAARERTERCRRGGLVERSRLRHPPVEQQRLQVVVAQADPPDVAVGRLAVSPPRRCRLAQREPAEGEPLVDVAQLA